MPGINTPKWARRGKKEGGGGRIGSITTRKTKGKLSHTGCDSRSRRLALDDAMPWKPLTACDCSQCGTRPISGALRASAFRRKRWGGQFSRDVFREASEAKSWQYSTFKLKMQRENSRMLRSAAAGCLEIGVCHPFSIVAPRCVHLRAIKELLSCRRQEQSMRMHSRSQTRFASVLLHADVNKGTTHTDTEQGMLLCCSQCTIISYFYLIQALGHLVLGSSLCCF